MQKYSIAKLKEQIASVGNNKYVIITILFYLLLAICLVYFFLNL